MVAGTVFPMPPLDLADREYFRAHRDNLVQGVFIGEVVRARTTNAQGQPRFFALSRKRPAPNGEFAGRDDDLDLAGLLHRVLFAAAAARDRGIGP